ncbi:uncharacterized protein [Miscanthus floridulus]|uniref:uncharacterized protein n=1 Tax=Miscanthus floridulus TaxID=154761 RepID=UPI00345A0954
MGGATSFEYLRTVDGVIVPTFCEAVERRGLIEEDNTLDESLAEATEWMVPYAMRRLFATILLFCEASNVFGLWEKHKEAMLEDYMRNNQSSFMVQQMVRIDIQKLLQSMKKDIKIEIFEETSIEANRDDVALSDTLNEEQWATYDEIMSSVDTEHGGVFFVEGPGGTGKTYLYKALLATICSQKKIAMATATSGVAASIMPSGRTAHSCFNIPLTIDDGAFCNFTKQSGTAKLLRASSLIIWDEATMTKRQSVEALDNSLRDIMDQPELSFGGKIMVFGGDFR